MIRNTLLRRTDKGIHGRAAKMIAIVLSVLLVMSQSMLVYASGDRQESKASSETSQDNSYMADTDDGEAPAEQAESGLPVEEPESDADQEEGQSAKEQTRSLLQHTGSGLALTEDNNQSDEDEDDSGENDTITVRVSIKNDTYPKSQGAIWEGTLIDTEVTVPSDYSMMQAIHKVCQDRNIPSRGTNGSYISMIGGLSEFDGGGGSGWMGTLNDWFVDQGFDQMNIKDGDVIQVEYTCSLGEDLGSSFNIKDKRVSALTASVGELAPEFDPDFKSYNLMVPEGTTELSIFTTAVNRNYLVKSIVNGKEYERGSRIPVSDGTKIQVKCGDPSWPSMNSYDQTDTAEPVTYTITVLEGSYDFLVDKTGIKCVIELDRESGIYSAGEKVTATLEYNSDKYKVIEDKVRAYIGGSKKYITLTREENDKYSFTMPCNDVEVIAECETKPDWPLSVTGSLTGCTMTMDHEDGKYVRDEKVTFTLSADSGKRINDLSVVVEEEESGDRIEIDHESQDRYSFTMPGEDVTVYAESEDRTANGLRSYTISTAYGDVEKQLTDDSRTSICDLPEKAVEFGLSLDIDDSEGLTSVRVKDIFGTINAYAEPELAGLSVGTRNTALFGKDVTVTVITKDRDNKTHTYTIRIKTQKSTYYSENPDADIIPVSAPGSNDLIPYKKTLMTSGVTLYELDYPTVVQNQFAQDGKVYLRICPKYEEKPNSIAIRCKRTVFEKFDSSRWEYRNIEKPIIAIAGRTEDTPIELEFKLSSGEYVSRRYLLRITNGRYAKQKFRVLTSAGNPMTPTSFSIDGESISTSGLRFEDGCFTLDLAAGSHTATSMDCTVDFTVEADLNRPYKTDTVEIQTDTPEYKCTVNCPDKKVVYTITETSAGIDYVLRDPGSTFMLPPGRYSLKAYNESSHRYYKTTFVITDGDVNVDAETPYLMDPEYVVEELNRLEEIQAFDMGDGRLRIYLPDYQTGTIKVEPIVTETDGLTMYSEDEGDKTYYYVERDTVDHIMKLKYRVYNEPWWWAQYFGWDDPEKYYTDEMELYVPAYSDAGPGGGEEPEEPVPDVRTLGLAYSTEDGSVITGMQHTKDENDRYHAIGTYINVVEENGVLTAEQARKAGFKVRYTLRYAKNEGDAMVSVGYRTYMGAQLIAVSDDLPRLVFETVCLYDQTELLFSISPDISNYSGVGINGWYEVTAWFEDEDGNRSTSNTITVYKDSNPPVVTVTPDHYEGYYKEKPGSPVYTNKAVTVTVNAEDNGLGLHDKAYSFDKGTTWTDRNTITITGPETVDLYDIWVRDKLGNIITFKDATFDADMYGDPTGTRYSHGDDLDQLRWGDGEDWHNDPGKRYFYVDTEYPAVGVISGFDKNTNTLSLEVKAADQISGLDGSAYSFDGGETWQSSNRYTVTLGEYGADNIRVRDKAGNITIYDEDYTWTRDSFEGTGPVINNVSVQYGGGGGIGYDGRKWYQSAVVKIEAEAGGSEIAGYSFDGQSFIKSDSIAFDAGRMFAPGMIQVIDKAGNIAVYDTAVDVTNVDSVAPVIDMYSFKGHAESTVKEIYLSIEADDAASKGLKYAVTVIPIDEYRRGYPMPDLQLEWADSFDDGQFKVSNIGKKYDRDLLVKGGKVLPGIIGKTGPSPWGIRMWVKDAAGNISYYDTWTDGGYIDQEGPKITEVTTEYKRFDDKSGIVRVYVAATEPKYGSGLAFRAYSFDGGETWQASNSISIPIGASIPAGQIMVRDDFGNISVYNKVVKTTLQDVITRINRLDPETANDKDFKEILDLFKQLSERDRSKVYNWQDFLDMLGNRKDQDWDDDFGDIGEPDDGGEQGGDQPDPGDDQEGDGEDDGGAGEDDGKPSDGSGNGRGGGKPEARDADGGNDTDTVSVALSNTSTSNTPDVKSKTGPNYREAEIDKKGAGGMLSQGMVKLWELILLIIIVGGAYTYGAQKRYRRYRNDAA